jgi:hypothetical protein
VAKEKKGEKRGPSGLGKFLEAGARARHVLPYVVAVYERGNGVRLFTSVTALSRRSRRYLSIDDTVEERERRGAV